MTRRVRDAIVRLLFLWRHPRKELWSGFAMTRAFTELAEAFAEADTRGKIHADD